MSQDPIIGEAKKCLADLYRARRQYDSVNATSSIVIVAIVMVVVMMIPAIVVIVIAYEL
jgi:hypothetical protein